MKIATFALLLLIVSAECRNLTESENQMRLRNCGRQMLETPPVPDGSDPTDSIPLTFPQDGFIGNFIFIERSASSGTILSVAWTVRGTFISPRHILTSSLPVMDHRKKWFGNYLEGNVSEYIQVPLSFLHRTLNNFTIVVRIQNDKNVTEGLDFEVEDAWLHWKYQDDVYYMGSPMIVTLKKDNPNAQYPCLVTSSTALNVTQKVHIYSLHQPTTIATLFDNSQVDYRYLPITGFTADGRWINTAQYGLFTDKGAPLIVEIDGKVTIVGMTAYPPHGYHYDLRALNDQICHLSGVCNPKDPEDVSTTVALPPSSTVPPTSTSISTDSSTSASTSTSTSTPTSTPASTSKTSNSTSPTIATSTESSTSNLTWKAPTTGKPYTDEYEEEYLDDSEDDMYEHFEVTADFLMRSRSVGWNWNWAVLGVVWLVVR